MSWHEIVVSLPKEALRYAAVVSSLALFVGVALVGIQMWRGDALICADGSFFAKTCPAEVLSDDRIGEVVVTAIDERLPGAIDERLPDGAVIPFDLAECPTVWTAETRAEGRFIIGTGVHSDFNSHGTAVAPKTLGQEGGEDQVRLEIAHMPSHSHANPTQGGTPTSNFSALRATDNGFRGTDSMPHGRPTSPRGGGLPHDNMPPFLALKFCRKG